MITTRHDPASRADHLELSGDSVLRPAGGVLAHWLADELIVLSADGRLLRGLNAAAGQLYLRVDGRSSLFQLADAIAAAAGAEKELVRADVVRVATALRTHGLLTAVEGMPPTPARPPPLTAWTEPAIVWEQRFVGLQTLSDCRPPTQNGNCP